MMVLDTHLWVWLVNGDLKPHHQNWIDQHADQGLGISVISCWEVAKLVELQRLRFSCPVEEWMAEALLIPGLTTLELTPEIAIESTKLPGPFHRDPADQIIVATARFFDAELLTEDRKILDYPHVKAV